MTTTRLQDALPLSPLQEGLLFHALYDDAVDVYQAQLTLRLRGPLDATALRAAAAALVARHAALRTGGRPRRLTRTRPPGTASSTPAAPRTAAAGSTWPSRRYSGSPWSAWTPRSTA
jgi:hypothetical protein